jgi:hypothetical protein
MKKFLSILAGLSCFILAGGAVAQGFAGDKQAVVALAEEQQIVYLGDKISVEEKTLRYGEAFFMFLPFDQGGVGERRVSRR